MSNSRNRRIQFYPTPLYSKLITAFKHVNCQYESEVVRDAVKEFFDKMPQSERNKLLAVYNEMTPEERGIGIGKKPKRE